MKYEITAKYTEAFLRRITLQFVNRWIGWKFYVMLVAEVIALLYFIRTDSNSWFIPTIGLLLVIHIAIVIRMYTVYLKNSVAVFRQIPNQTVIFVFDDEGVSVQSEAGSGNLKWKLIPQLWQFPDAWLIFTSKNTYSTFPISEVSEEVKNFVISKIKETGGKVS